MFCRGLIYQAHTYGDKREQQGAIYEGISTFCRGLIYQARLIYRGLIYLLEVFDSSKCIYNTAIVLF